MKKIILVDGNNLLFRSFYATAYQGVIMKNSKGFPTNALYGFINMMNKIIKEEKPTYIMVAFDKGKTFRHDKYEEYKAGRSAMPDELKLQFPKAKEVLETMGIKYFEIDNYEADDIIGTLAKRVDEENEFGQTHEVKGGTIDLSEGPKLRYDAKFGPQDLNFDIKIINPY